MKKNKSDKQLIEPTKSELKILQVLWKHGPSTVRFVNDMLNQEKEAEKGGVNYTSTLKLMQIMFEKKLLQRDETSMKHIYFPMEKEEETKTYLLERFVNSMYNGSASKMVMQLLGNKSTSKEELDAIKELVKKLDKK